jgi:hypothetical protein
MKYSTLFAIALLGASTAMASTGNIVANGSFEVLPGALNHGTWGQFSTLTGWSQLNGDSFEIQLAKNFQTPSTGYYNAFDKSSSDNSAHYLEINSNTLGVVAQTLQTISGQSYKLSFDYSGRSDSGTGNNSKADVYWGSQLVASLNETPNSGWKSFDFTLSATGQSTVLKFVSTAPSTNPSYGSFLDAVSVTAVPEPGSMAMLLAGLGLIGTMVLRRNK